MQMRLSVRASPLAGARLPPPTRSQSPSSPPRRSSQASFRSEPRESGDAGARLAEPRPTGRADWPLRAGKMLSKGTKRKRSEDEALDNFVTTTPSSSLFSLSVSKLHQSLQHVEPNLRHLVLVANTIRRLQGEMQPAAAPILPPAFGGGDLPADDCAGSASLSIPLEPCRKTPVSLAPHVDELLLSNMDVSVFSTILEDLSGTEGLGDSLQPSLAQPGSSRSPEPERTSPPASLSSLEMLGPGGYLLEDGLEGLFEDIDTSMYDSDLWPATSLPNLKEAFSTTGQEKLDLADLDYLMDMLVEAQQL